MRLHLSIGQHLAVFRRRNTLLLFENTTEIERVFVSDNRSNFSDIIVRGFKQANGVVDTNVKDVLHWGFHGKLLEITKEPAHTHSAGLGVVFNADILVIMLVEVSSGKFDFFLDVGVNGGLALFPASLNQ